MPERPELLNGAPKRTPLICRKEHISAKAKAQNTANPAFSFSLLACQRMVRSEQRNGRFQPSPVAARHGPRSARPGRTAGRSLAPFRPPCHSPERHQDEAFSWPFNSQRLVADEHQNPEESPCCIPEAFS